MMTTTTTIKKKKKREGTQEDGRKETDFGLWASAEATIMVKALLGDSVFKCHLLPSPSLSLAPLTEIPLSCGRSLEFIVSSL